jgi:hypothetical protein
VERGKPRGFFAGWRLETLTDTRVRSLFFQVEAAFDIVLMRSFMKRSAGEVSDAVRYADVVSVQQRASSMGAKAGAYSGPLLSST